MKRSGFFYSVTVFYIVSLILLFLISRYWLPSGVVLTGHDSGLPLLAKEFLNGRFFAWDSHIGFGVDNSLLFGSITLHLIDYISSVVSRNLFAGNWFNLFFWMTALFSAATFFAFSFRKILGNFFIFLFPTFIVVNFYVAQSIFILERAKYSTLVATLVIFPLALRVFERRVSILLTSIVTSIVLFIFNGGSLLAVSLYGNLFVMIFGVLLFYVIYCLKQKNFRPLFRFVGYLLLTSIFTILLNAYQLVPYLPGILDKDYLSHLGGTVLQSKDWVDYISKNTSFINLFRLQGVPNWYTDLYTANLDHTYSSVYLNGILHMLVSFLFPVLSALSLIFSRSIEQKKLVSLFFLIVLVSMFFASGTHAPFGFIYGFLYQKVPGFFVFRNPYYKFGGAFLISFCVLLAASLSFLLSNCSVYLNKKKINNLFKLAFPALLTISILLLWLGYHFESLKPDNIFAWKTKAFTRASVPSYVWDFEKWNKLENKSSERILLLPSLNKQDFADSYTWGYWSLSPLTYVLADVPALINEADLSHEEMAWVDKLYESLNNNDPKTVDFFSQRLGVGYFLLRKDVSPETQYQKSEIVLLSNQSVSKVATFGLWDLYKLKNGAQKTLKSLPNLTLVDNGNIYLAREMLKGNAVSGLSSDTLNKLQPFIGERIRSYSCQSCLLENIAIHADLPAVTVFPNSPLYFLKDRRERKALVASKDDAERIINYLVNALRRTSESRSMFILGIEDRYIKISLQTTNTYLSDALGILERHVELKTNYLMAKQTLDIVNPLLNELHHFVISNDFGRRPAEVRQMAYEEVKKLNSLVDYFSAIALPQNYLRDHKIYSISGKEDLLLDTYSLSVDTQGRRVLPQRITYAAGEVKQDLSLQRVDERWVKISVPDYNVAGFLLTLQFSQPSLFVDAKKEIKQFSSGSIGCITGSIYNFSPSNNYQIEVLARSKAQQLGIFLQTTQKGKVGDMAKGADIYPVEISSPFSYVFESDMKDESATVLICSEDRDLPDLETVSVYEMNSPVLSTVEKTGGVSLATPNIFYKKVNETRYVLDVDNSDTPFVLGFDNRYSRLWNLYPISPEDVSPSLFIGIQRQLERYTQPMHFSLDGYANAWLVDVPGKSKWVLEYIPQEYFYVGAVVSIIMLLMLVGLLVFIFKRRGR